MAFPARGEIWMANLDPVRVHEQSGVRPCLIVSDDSFNAGPAGLVIVLPVTSKEKNVRSHVEVHGGEGGLRQRSFIKCEDVRSISKERLSRRLGLISSATLEAVEDVLRILMNL